ncbi:hypothetical protein [Micromonospora sonneratiae]|uniref:MYXO-CTERM domain-containing protein n=1 Tax=Micromonospora sonneratiae TaxID=1184706 RepID=A0ABW3YFS4_9ACTN
MKREPVEWWLPLACCLSILSSWVRQRGSHGAIDGQSPPELSVTG